MKVYTIIIFLSFCLISILAFSDNDRSYPSTSSGRAVSSQNTDKKTELYQFLKKELNKAVKKTNIPLFLRIIKKAKQENVFDKLIKDDKLLIKAKKQPKKNRRQGIKVILSMIGVSATMFGGSSLLIYFSDLNYRDIQELALILNLAGQLSAIGALLAFLFAQPDEHSKLIKKFMKTQHPKVGGKTHV